MSKRTSSARKKSLIKPEEITPQLVVHWEKIKKLFSKNPVLDAIEENYGTIQKALIQIGEKFPARFQAELILYANSKIIKSLKTQKWEKGNLLKIDKLVKSNLALLDKSKDASFIIHCIKDYTEDYIYLLNPVIGVRDPIFQELLQGLDPLIQENIASLRGSGQEDSALSLIKAYTGTLCRLLYHNKDYPLIYPLIKQNIELIKASKQEENLSEVVKKFTEPLVYKYSGLELGLENLQLSNEVIKDGIIILREEGQIKESYLLMNQYQEKIYGVFHDKLPELYQTLREFWQYYWEDKEFLSELVKTYSLRVLQGLKPSDPLPIKAYALITESLAILESTKPEDCIEVLKSYSNYLIGKIYAPKADIAAIDRALNKNLTMLVEVGGIKELVEIITSYNTCLLVARNIDLKMADKLIKNNLQILKENSSVEGYIIAIQEYNQGIARSYYDDAEVLSSIIKGNASLIRSLMDEGHIEVCSSFVNSYSHKLWEGTYNVESLLTSNQIIQENLNILAYKKREASGDMICAYNTKIFSLLYQQDVVVSLDPVIRGNFKLLSEAGQFEALNTSVQDYNTKILTLSYDQSSGSSLAPVFRENLKLLVKAGQFEALNSSVQRYHTKILSFLYQSDAIVILDPVVRENFKLLFGAGQFEALNSSVQRYHTKIFSFLYQCDAVVSLDPVIRGNFKLLSEAGQFEALSSSVKDYHSKILSMGRDQHDIISLDPIVRENFKLLFGAGQFAALGSSILDYHSKILFFLYPRDVVVSLDPVIRGNFKLLSEAGQFEALNFSIHAYNIKLFQYYRYGVDEVHEYNAIIQANLQLLRKSSSSESYAAAVCAYNAKLLDVVAREDEGRIHEIFKGNLKLLKEAEQSPLVVAFATEYLNKLLAAITWPSMLDKLAPRIKDNLKLIVSSGTKDAAAIAVKSYSDKLLELLNHWGDNSPAKTSMKSNLGFILEIGRPGLFKEIAQSYITKLKGNYRGEEEAAAIIPNIKAMWFINKLAKYLPPLLEPHLPKSLLNISVKYLVGDAELDTAGYDALIADYHGAAGPEGQGDALREILGEDVLLDLQ